MPINKRIQMNFISLITILVVIISHFSCQKSQNSNPKEGFDSYKFEKEREFLVHSLSTVELLDYYPEDSLYLGYTNTPSGKEICLVKENGEIILKKNLQGDGPDKYGANLSCLGFTEDGDIWAVTSVQVLRYNQNLELLEKFAYKPNHMVNLYYFTERFQFYRKDSNSASISFPVNPSGRSRNVFPFEDYSTAKLLELHDQSSKLSIEIAPISERKVTEEFIRVVQEFYAPVFFIDVNSFKMYLTATFDNQITVFDLAMDSVINSINIYYGDPNAVKPGSEISTNSLKYNAEGWLQSPMNHKMFKLDSNLLLLEYLSDVSIDPDPENGIFSGSMHKDIFKNNIILFKGEHQISGDLTFPVKGIIMTSLPGNRLLVRVENFELEDDFTRYHLYRLI
jgi:hypothetical protein